MNKRDFLKLLLPMPFALPSIVSACGKPKPKPISTLRLRYKGGEYIVSGHVSYAKFLECRKIAKNISFTISSSDSALAKALNNTYGLKRKVV